MFFFWLLVTGAIACQDSNAKNNGQGASDNTDCVYVIKVGSAVPASYKGEWGIEAAVAQLNENGMILGSNGLKFEVDFTNYALDNSATKDSTAEVHRTQVNTMVAENDFIVGGGPWYAAEEVAITNAEQKVSVLCCTGPDPIYETASAMNWNGAFGVHAPPEYYPQHIIRHAALAKGDSKASKIGIVWGYGNVFTKQVASKNKEMAENDLEMEVVVYKPYPFIMPESDLDLTPSDQTNAPAGTFVNECNGCTNREYIAGLAKEMYDKGAEVVLVCGMNFDAYLFSQELHKLDPYHEQFKAIFMTVGATKSDWMTKAGVGGQYVTSGGQWDKKMELCGDWFGPNWPVTKRTDYCSSDWNTYVENYIQTVTAKDPTWEADYESASGAAAFYTLMRGVAEAYKNEDITFPLSWDQTKVRDALMHMNVNTYFGAIGFNSIQRNDKKESVAIQWVPNDAGDGFVKKVIYPISGQERDIEYPVPRCLDNTAAEPDCKAAPSPASGDDDDKNNTALVVIIVALVLAVILLSAVVMYIKNKKRSMATFDNDTNM